jgi:hypothetical protein
VSTNVSRDPFRALAKRVREVCRHEAEDASGRDVRGIVKGVAPIKISLPSRETVLTAGVDDILEVTAHVAEKAVVGDAVLVREHGYGWVAMALLKE